MVMIMMVMSNEHDGDHDDDEHDGDDQMNCSATALICPLSDQNIWDPLFKRLTTKQ